MNDLILFEQKAYQFLPTKNINCTQEQSMSNVREVYLILFDKKNKIQCFMTVIVISIKVLKIYNNL